MAAEQPPQTHYASAQDVVTACGRIRTQVTASGNRRKVSCPTCLTKIRRL